jgi:hypothetical protein
MRTFYIAEKGVRYPHIALETYVGIWRQHDIIRVPRAQFFRAKLIAASMKTNKRHLHRYSAQNARAAIESKDRECRTMKRGDWIGELPRRIQALIGVSYGDFSHDQDLWRRFDIEKA